MADIQTFFYNSSSKDRLYDANSFELWLKKFFTTGVFQDDYQVTANGDMTVTVGSGYANINGKVAMAAASTTLDIATASGTLNRIDAVVLRRDDTNRLCKLMIVQGSNAQTPVAPDLVRTGGIYDIRLAEIYVGAGVVKITQANITDKRADSTVCGWVISTVSNIDSTQMLAQLTAQFDDWFAAMKGQLTTDAAGNLQTEIDANKLKYKTPSIAVSSVAANTDALSADYPYYFDYSITGMTADYAADVFPASLADSSNFNSCTDGTNQTIAGKIRIYFFLQPTTAVNLQIVYQKGVSA